MPELKIKTFVFNPFQENTYLLYSDEGNCLIIDPGCSDPSEYAQLDDFIQEEGLTPTELLLTHAHIDHILGLHFVENQYGLEAHCHPAELDIFRSGKVIADTYGLVYTEASLPTADLGDGELLNWEGVEIQQIWAPGHSPGSICFYIPTQSVLIGGDVLFHQSIGRTDLPGGNHDQLLESILTKIYTLPDATRVLSGHGMETEIGFERENNMFIRG